jgi:ferredoxin
MVTVEFEGTEIECSEDDILRDVLLEAGETPHNGRADYINCHGLGTCGTCAVEVDGAVSDPTRRERRRLRFPPHTPERGLRLSCQTRVLGDITVAKHDGFWGQSVTDEE